MNLQNNIREQLVDIILNVAMQHHDDISKADEDAACNAADVILEKMALYSIKNIVMRDGICYYCNKKVNSIAGNPSEWPVFLPHSDEPGVPKPHHIGCVMLRLNKIDGV